MNYKYLALLFLLLLCNGCKRKPLQPFFNKKIITCHKPSITQLKHYPMPHTIHQDNDTLTIWIHGTKMFFSKYICPNFFYTRNGLHAATSFDPQYHLREIAEMLQHADPQRFPLQNFYFFGWSGKLSFKARYKAGRKLYNALLVLVENYEKKYHCKPKIRIITHSHGGNVALNIARFNNDLTLQMDEIILLACPVQKRTCHFSEHHTFKKIYSLYSRFDSFQILDPQRVYYWLKKDLAETSEKPESFFSGRCFAHNDKMLQVQLKFNNRGIMHIEFLSNKFVGVLPAILNEIEQWENYPHHGSNILAIKLT